MTDQQTQMATAQEAQEVQDANAKIFNQALTWLCAHVPIDQTVPVDKDRIVAFSGIPKSYVRSFLAELAEQGALVQVKDGISYVYKRTPKLNRISATEVREATLKRFLGKGHWKAGDSPAAEPAKQSGSAPDDITFFTPSDLVKKLEDKKAEVASEAATTGPATNGRESVETLVEKLEKKLSDKDGALGTNGPSCGNAVPVNEEPAKPIAAETGVKTPVAVQSEYGPGPVEKFDVLNGTGRADEAMSIFSSLRDRMNEGMQQAEEKKPVDTDSIKESDCYAAPQLSQASVSQYGYVAGDCIVWSESREVCAQRCKELLTTFDEVVMVKRVGRYVNVPTFVPDDAA